MLLVSTRGPYAPTGGNISWVNCINAHSVTRWHTQTKVSTGQEKQQSNRNMRTWCNWPLASLQRTVNIGPNQSGSIQRVAQAVGRTKTKASCKECGRHRCSTDKLKWSTPICTLPFWSVRGYASQQWTLELLREPLLRPPDLLVTVLSSRFPSWIDIFLLFIINCTAIIFPSIIKPSRHPTTD